MNYQRNGSGKLHALVAIVFNGWNTQFSWDAMPCNDPGKAKA